MVSVVVAAATQDNKDDDYPKNPGTIVIVATAVTEKAAHTEASFQKRYIKESGSFLIFHLFNTYYADEEKWVTKFLNKDLNKEI